MSVVTEYKCDNCESLGAEHVGPLDLGDGARMIDLDVECQRLLGLPTFIEVMSEYGDVQADMMPFPVSGGRRSVPTASDIDCPICNQSRASRKGAIDHVVRRHGVSPVEASKMFPIGRAMLCPECGMLIGGGQGLSAHLRSEHPQVDAKAVVASLKV